MKSFIFCVALFLLPHSVSAQFSTQFTIPVDIEGTKIDLPTNAEIRPKTIFSYDVALRVTLEGLVRLLEIRAARELQGDAQFRGLEMRPWRGDGLSVKVLLKLSCLGSNASVRVYLLPTVSSRSVSFSVEGVEINVSNDLCRLAGDVVGVTDALQYDLQSTMQEVLSGSLWLDDLPASYSALPFNLKAVSFGGADRGLFATIEGHLGTPKDE